MLKHKKLLNELWITNSLDFSNRNNNCLGSPVALYSYIITKLLKYNIKGNIKYYKGKTASFSNLVILRY